MAAIRSKNTKPELLVRRLLHSLGYRYRLHRKDLPGKPDLAFPGRKKAVFVHGCFWHQHSEPSCTASRRPTTNTSYWGPKLERNIERDARAVRLLCEAGWQSLTLWECELRDIPALERKIVTFLRKPGPPQGSIP
jgi:DNA mismatch endonuclease (patch repair protein)